MPVISPRQKNKRNCECCGSAYVANGDESAAFCIIPWYETKCCKSSYTSGEGKIVCDKCKKMSGLTVMEKKGFCEFCDSQNKKWFVKNMKCHNGDQRR